MNEVKKREAQAVDSTALLAASIGLKKYLESPCCAVPNFDIPDEVWMPFAEAVEAANDMANAEVSHGDSEKGS